MPRRSIAFRRRVRRKVLHHRVDQRRAGVVRTWVPNVLDPEFKQLGHMEGIGLTYEKIVWT